MITGRLLSTRARRWAALAVVAVVGGGLLSAAWRPAEAAPVPPELVRISVPAGPGLSGDLDLDAALYVPAVTPAPAVLLAHGFGGSRLSVTADAQRLTRAGFVVLAYSARGFGLSDGLIGLDSLDYEVADGRALVDWLADRPEVLQDGPGDPRVGVTGGSYGGALALMLAGTDQRVDAVAAIATWNDLGRSLFPNNLGVGDSATPAAAGDTSDGVFKSSWTAALMSSVIAAGLDGPDTPAPDGALLCGRLLPELCAAYSEVAETGRTSAAMDELLARSSPAAVVGGVTAPTLLVQGTSDTLFGLDQADANARAIAATGAPVAVTWYAGGHVGSPPDEATAEQVDDWLTYYLTGVGPEPSTAFRYTVAGPVSERGRPRMRTLELPGYPGLDGRPGRHQVVTMTGQPQLLLNPPGGQPAAITSLPGLPATLSSLASLGSLPGQTATFVSAPLDDALVVTGSIPVTLSVGRVGGAGDAVLYLSAAAVDGAAPATGPPVGEDGTDDETDETADDSPFGAGAVSIAGGGPAGGAVAAIRIPDLPADGSTRQITVTLPAVAFQVGAGKRLAIRVATTDQAFAGERSPALYTVALAEPTVAVPAVGGIRAGGDEEPVGLAIGLGLLIVIAAAGLTIAGRVRRPATPPIPAGDIPPLTITGLSKQYPGPVHAVRDVSLTVERGQVLGLLGPNGAGKTTTLRMVMGLITPSSGEISIFGEPAGPGAPVLSRIGSFVEGAGFLPHLSGAANLDLYWRATGRSPDAAHLAEALEIAGLGNAVRRKVKTYSQGMRQRLAIAQAMLGLPDLLILDEPTNGLDPPQIHAMREVLRRYADTGRTVLVSSHLLAEVEQTCTHVVVMAQGRTIAAGTVAELVAASGQFTIGTSQPDAGASYLADLDGIGAVTPVAGGLSVDLGSVELATVLRTLLDAGVPIASAAPRHRLEDVFLELVEEEAT